MGLVFDPAKDRANLEKHGISLARAAEMDVALVIEDERFDYGEERYRAFGFIKDAPIAWCSRSAAMRSGQSACGARMRRKSGGMSARKKTETDQENPEWTEADFARAKPPHEVLPADALSVFKGTRGPQRAATKVPISIRLSPEVVEHFKAGGPGWQSRIDDTLKKAINRDRG